MVLVLVLVAQQHTRGQSHLLWYCATGTVVLVLWCCRAVVLWYFGAVVLCASWFVVRCAGLQE